ncbi:MAG: hypothetical protein AB7G06_05260 [Bdellovibrionales bacterium]
MKDTARLQVQKYESLSFVGTFMLAAAAYLFMPTHAFASEGVSSGIGKLTENVGSLPGFIEFLFYIIGISLTARGLYLAKKNSEGGQQQASVLSIFVSLTVGALFIAAPVVADTIINSIYGADGAATAPTSNVEGGSGDELTVGQSIANVANEVFAGGALDLVSYFCFIIAILLLGSALSGAYKIGSGGQGAPKLSGVVWRAIGAGALMTLPLAIDVVRKSIFANADGTEHFDLRQVQEVTGESTGLDAALVRLVLDVKDPVINIVFLVVFLCGVLIIAKALYDMSGINFEQSSQTKPGQMVTRLIIGGILVSSWSIYQAVTFTLTGGEPTDSGASALAYVGDAFGDQAERINNTLNAVFVWIQLFGIIAFFRGWFTLKGSLDGTAQSPKSAGVTQVIAGALCINIHTTVAMIGNTLGIEILA